MRILALPFVALLLASPVTAQRSAQHAAQAWVRVSARTAAHERMIVIDTHLDIAGRAWTTAAGISRERHVHAEDGSQVDLPRMREGGLDGGFFVIYTAPGRR